MAARADEAAAGPRADGNGNVVKEKSDAEGTDETGLREGWPRRRRVKLLAIPGRQRSRRAGASLRQRSAEMRDVPLHRADRVLVVHVHVVEPFDSAGLRVFDHDAVGAAQVAKAAVARRLHAL